MGSKGAHGLLSFAPFLFGGALLFQNVAESFFLRWSRQSMATSGIKYDTQAPILLTQVLKLVISVVMARWSDHILFRDMVMYFWNLGAKQWVIMAMPAFLYTLQNNLRYLALSYIASSTYQLLIQSKIITTAVMSVVMLQVKIVRIQWLILAILFASLVLTQRVVSHREATQRAGMSQQLLHGMDKLSKDGVNSTSTGSVWDVFKGGTFFGCFCTICVSLSSGFAGCYMELIVKQRGSFWILNLHLCIMEIAYGLVLYLMGGGLITADFFKGIYGVTWIVIVLGSIGGILVGQFVRVSSSLTKTYILSLVIFLNPMLDAASGSTDVVGTIEFWLCVVLVFVSVVAYNDPDVVGLVNKNQDKTPAPTGQALRGNAEGDVRGPGMA